MASNRNPIKASELLSLADYERGRPKRVAEIIRLKNRRRVELGPWICVVFENRATVLYQIQEMLRIERITAPEAVAHEIETYAELLPGPGELSATFFIEISDAQQRRRALARLGGIERSVALRVGERRAPAYDKRPIDPRFARPGQATAVSYLGFRLSDADRNAFLDQDVWLEAAHPAYKHAAALSEAAKKSLAEDWR